MKNMTKIDIAFSICGMLYLGSNILNKLSLIKTNLKKETWRKKIFNQTVET